MASLADVERFLERLFERSTARLFRARVQPVQLERRVERTMERARSARSGRTVVPGRYRVRLHPEDLESVAGQAGGPDALAGRLADAALAFARGHAYHVPGRPSVALVADPSLPRGQLEVDAVQERPSREPHEGQRMNAAPEPQGRAGTLAPNPIIAAIEPDLRVPAQSTDPATPAPALAGPLPAPAFGGIRGDGTETLVFRRPAPERTHAQLRVIAPGASERTVAVDGTPLTVGRSRDNALVLEDGRVSRHHGRLQARRGTLVYTDLGSTNGSRVNGIRVDEIALGVGDRLLLGDTVLVVETLPG